MQQSLILSKAVLLTQLCHCYVVDDSVPLQVAFLLPTFQRLEGPGGLYLGFAGMAALAWVVMYFTVIETKMKTLEEIEAIMIGRKPNHRGSSNDSLQGGQNDVQLSKSGYVHQQYA